MIPTPKDEDYRADHVRVRVIIAREQKEGV